MASPQPRTPQDSPPAQAEADGQHSVSPTQVQESPASHARTPEESAQAPLVAYGVKHRLQFDDALAKRQRISEQEDAWHMTEMIHNIPSHVLQLY